MATAQRRAKRPLALANLSRARVWWHHRSYALALSLGVALLVANILAVEGFGESGGWEVQLTAFAPFALVAMASAPSILGGGVDLSIGPLMVLANAVLVAVLLPHGLGQPVVAIPLLLALGAGVGAISGTLVALLRYQPIFATLCLLFVVSGVTERIVATPRSAPPNWTEHLAGSLGPIPVAALVIAVPPLIWYALQRTPYVPALLAVGAHEPAAYSAGLNVRAVKLVSYVLGGLFAAIGGIALTALLETADAAVSNQYVLVAMAAVILGGTPIGGGRGGLKRCILGAACIYLLQNFLSSANVPATWVQVTYGLLLLIAVVLAARASEDRSVAA